MDKNLHEILNENCPTRVLKKRTEAVEKAFEIFSNEPTVINYFECFEALMDCIANTIASAKIIKKLAGSFGEYIASLGEEEKIERFFNDPNFEEDILSHDDRIIYGYLYLSVGYAFLGGYKDHTRTSLEKFFMKNEEYKKSLKCYTKRMQLDDEHQERIRQEQIAANNAYMASRRH